MPTDEASEKFFQASLSNMGESYVHRKKQNIFSQTVFGHYCYHLPNFYPAKNLGLYNPKRILIRTINDNCLSLT